jgi:membrane protein implicated in regulation of membrane protease activity
VDAPETWRWIWLVATGLFVAGEVGTGGSLFLLPFAVGAFVAGLLAFAGVTLIVQWIAFLAVSVAGLVATNGLRKRLDHDTPQDGIGARRVIGQPARVVRELPGGPGVGSVVVGREEWRAESLDGQPIAEGAVVKVVDVRGTRLIVHPQQASLEPGGSS